MKNIKSKNLIIVLLLIMFLAVSVFVNNRYVYAGDINGAEAGVIAAASGTFEYEGKYYRAGSQYLSQLYSYLAQDDIDLSENKANTAIRMMYRNIPRGVREGYLYEIKTDPEPTTEDTSNTTENNPDNTTEKNNENTTGDVTTTTEQVTTEATTDSSSESGENSGSKKDYLADAGKYIISYSDFMNESYDTKEEKMFVEDFFDSIETNVANNETLKKRPTATESDAVIMADSDGFSLDTSGGNISVKVKERIIPVTFTTIFVIIPVVLLVITAICAVILTASGCMRFKGKDRRKPKRGHTVRRRIRKINRVILTISSMLSITGLLLIISVMIGIYNDTEILQSVQSSGYYRYAYIEYISDIDNSVSGYETFMIEQKQSEEKMLSGEIDVSEAKYASAIPYVVQIRKELTSTSVISAIIYLINIILAFVMLMFMDLRRDRGLKSIAIAEIVPAILFILFTILLYVINVPSRVFIDPDHLYIFFTNAYKWIEKVFIIISAFMVIIGMSLIGIYKSRRKDK